MWPPLWRVAGLKSNQYYFSTQRIILYFNIIFKLIHRQEVIFPKIKNCLAAKKSKEKEKLRLEKLSHKNLILEIGDLKLDEEKKSVLDEMDATMEQIRLVQNQVNNYKAFKANTQCLYHLSTPKLP